MGTGPIGLRRDRSTCPLGIGDLRVGSAIIRYSHKPATATRRRLHPVLIQQRDEATAFADDATGRGWDSETERHLKLINRINDLITAADARGQAM